MPDKNFADSASLIGGQAVLILGWRPWEFWQSTPAELQMAMSAFLPAGDQAMDRAALEKLMQQHPDNIPAQVGPITHELDSRSIEDG